MPAQEKTAPTKSQQKHASAHMPSTSSARLKEADPTWRAKLWLRALAAVLSLASISCFCTALFVWPQPAWEQFFWLANYIRLPTDVLPLFPLFWFVLFAILFSTYLFARKRPIHPGCVIASDLAVWVTIGGLGAWIVFGSVFWDYVGVRNAVCVKSSRIETYCNSARRTKGSCELAGLSRLAATLFAHFALFVWLCREVDVRRKREKRRELEALYPQQYREDEDGHVAEEGGVPGVKMETKREERMAAVELSW